ncbi:MAG: phosphoethanolamine transferase [Alphaproteobacteria bacterium]|nr:phosphoethanolamine transferase [Alphaproteobacteria bacterium]
MKWLQHRYPRSLLVLLAALLYFALYVVPEFLLHYRGPLFAPGVAAHQAQLLLTVFVQTYCILFALTIAPGVCLALMPVLWALTARADYMTRVFQAQISKDGIAAVAEITTGEIGNFLAAPLVIAVLTGACAGLAVAGIIVLRERRQPQNRAAAMMAIAFTLISLLLSVATERYPPYNFLYAAEQYGIMRLHQHFTARTDIAAKIPSAWQAQPGEAPPVVVLVIGESARADHFHLNGYARETSPLLETRAHLVNFPHTVSCGVFTRVSVPCMLTRATHDNLAPIFSETSVLSVFRKLGFYVAWLGAQGSFSPADPATAIIGEANEHTLLTDRSFLANQVLDEQLLPLLEKALAGHQGPLVVVLHTLGSHWQYSARYPAAFSRFTPACGTTMTPNAIARAQEEEIKGCPEGLAGIVNGYDNSILYTDYILDQVIQRLVNRNALFMYVSDHAESLGEEGRFLHGHDDAPEDYQVPMFWWASDAFIAHHEKAWKALQAKTRMPVSQDYIFHSLLDCLGVQSALIDARLSLCRM